MSPPPAWHDIYGCWEYGQYVTECRIIVLGRPKDGLGIYIYSCHAGELFGFVPVARDEQAFSC